MAWALLLLTLLAHCTGVTSQEVVTQEASLSTTPGGTVTLTCGSSTGAVTASNYASWVQQKPYQRPQGLIAGTSYRIPGVPARFSGSLLGQKAILTITGAQTEDEAEYYCVLWYSNHCHRDRGRWGSET
uniref:Ig-like domain-containing protein n=1 Tax=Suricata suricatta TaxID=37032 RepID=A0A673UD24_SURSU